MTRLSVINGWENWWAQHAPSLSYFISCVFFFFLGFSQLISGQAEEQSLWVCCPHNVECSGRTRSQTLSTHIMLVWQRPVGTALNAAKYSVSTFKFLCSSNNTALQLVETKRHITRQLANHWLASWHVGYRAHALTTSSNMAAVSLGNSKTASNTKD